MPVNIKYSRAIKDPAAILNVSPVNSQGTDKTINTGAVAMAAGDDANSKVYLGKIPSSAIPDLRSQLQHDAIAGLTSAHIGIERNGQTVSAALFASALNLAAAAGTKNVFAAITIANTGRPVWQLAGLGFDPGCDYDVVLTANTNVTGPGNFAAQISYDK